MTCRDCGRSFLGEPWMTRCKGCYVEFKRAERREADYDRGYRDGFDHGHSIGVASRQQWVLPASFVADLIRLAHPDRHPAERFDLANRVTARLNAMREP